MISLLVVPALALVNTRQFVRLICTPEHNVIRVDIKGKSPIAVIERLTELVKETIDECCKFLTSSVWLKVDSMPDELVSLTAIREAVEKVHILSSAHDISRTVSHSQLTALFGSSWIKSKAFLSWYHLFLSYRWGLLDKKLTRYTTLTLTIATTTIPALNSRTSVRNLILHQTPNVCHLSRSPPTRISRYTVNPDNIAIEAFLDSQRLKDGMDFLDNFSAALVNSKALLPNLP
jgi:hypothetical protein